MHFASAISHPQSVGLSKRYVQMLMGRIQLTCLSLGSSWYWSREIRNAVLAINRRCIRIHENPPAEILLGFNPSMTHKIKQGFNSYVKRDNVRSGPGPKEPEESRPNSYILELEEHGLLDRKKLSRPQYHVSFGRSCGYRKPEAGDLVLVRDFS